MNERGKLSEDEVKARLRPVIRKFVREFLVRKVLNPVKEAEHSKHKNGTAWNDGGGWNAKNQNGVYRRYVSDDGQKKAQQWSKDTQTQPKKRAKPAQRGPGRSYSVYD